VALYRHPDQTLPVWYRYAIYQALLADQSRVSSAVRAWIDVLSVQHVLFCWQPYGRTRWHTSWPQPDNLLALAEQMLQGTAETTLIQRRIRRAEVLVDLMSEPASSSHYPAWCVFEAALRTLQSAWIYHLHSLNTATPNSRVTGEIGLDDASTYAAIAIAGGAVQSSSDRISLAGNTGQDDWQEAVQLRRTFFWEWWLREAIPQAWQRR
jgi:hypothetical protein